VRDVVLTLVIFGLLPLAALQPHVGIYLWYWISYMNPHRLTWGFAFSLPFAQVVALATLIGLLLNRERRRVPWTTTTATWLAFTLWVSLTTLFAINRVVAVEHWQRFMKIQIMTLVAIAVISRRDRIVGIVWVIVASIGFYGVKGGIFTALRGGESRVWGPPGGMIQGNNELAFALIVIIPLMRFLQMSSSRKWVRRGLTAVMLLSGLSILGSQSRGALLAGVAMTVTLVAKSRRRLLLGLAVLVFAAFLVQFAPERWVDRMQTIQTYEEDRSAMGRINAWWFAFNLAKDHPLLGGGFDVFMPETFLLYAPDPYDFHDSHSIYFGVLAEHGFVGLLLFLAMGASALRSGGRIRSLARGRDELAWARDLSDMVQVSLVGYAVGGAFLGLGYFDLLYNLVALMIMTHGVVTETLAAAPGVAAVREVSRRRPMTGRPRQVTKT
jgi:probable O-glycosylation ligase (exosortase A-associated)